MEQVQQELAAKEAELNNLRGQVKKLLLLLSGSGATELKCTDAEADKLFTEWVARQESKKKK